MNRAVKTITNALTLIAALNVSLVTGVASVYPNQSPVRQIVMANDLDLQLLGTLKTKTTREIESNSWSIGCETLGRGFADFDAYKDYLPALGAKIARIQSGWARTETVKGAYDFAWLDRIVDGLLERGVRPWITVCYGNPIYEGGGTISLGGGMPYSPEALKAWDAYVTALATRYATNVFAWEIWNEPDIGRDRKAQLPAEYAGLFARSARLIKGIDPAAKTWAFSLAGNTKFVDLSLSFMEENGALELIDEVTYHGYRARPEDNRGLQFQLLSVMKQHGLSVPIRQGENGCPSYYTTQFALSRIPWTELSQAKWFLRRMAEDCRKGIPTSLFSMADLNYRNSAHTGQSLVHNPKGLLATGEKDQVLYPKLAYFSTANMITLFDSSVKPAAIETTGLSKKGIEVAGYARQQEAVVLIWDGEDRPSDRLHRQPVSLTLKNTLFKEPVYLDILSGKVYELRADSWRVIDGSTQFTKIPVWDSPIALVERSFIEWVR